MFFRLTDMNVWFNLCGCFISQSESGFLKKKCLTDVREHKAKKQIFYSGTKTIKRKDEDKIKKKKTFKKTFK